MDQEGREQASSVALGVGQSSAILVLPEALERFRRAWPRTRVRVIDGVPDTLLPLVRHETLDFMLGADVPGRDPGIAFRPLFLSARVIAACKGHPLLKARTLQELQSTEWIRTPPLDSVVGPVETMFFDAGLIAPQISVHCDSYHTGTALMASSEMLALMARPANRSIFLLRQAHEPIPDINHCLFLHTQYPPPTDQPPIHLDQQLQRLWAIGMLMSLIRWLEILAFAVFTYDQTKSALWVASLMMLRLLPLSLFGLALGPLASQMLRRRLLLVTHNGLFATCFLDFPQLKFVYCTVGGPGSLGNLRRIVQCRAPHTLQPGRASVSTEPFETE